MTQSAAVIAAQRAPSVLVVLVVRDAAGWLRESLSALAAQTYPRLAVMAVDNGSTDGSGELLIHALGEGRVITLPADRGLAGALSVAQSHPVANEADYLLLLHDDAVLDPDGVTRMVEAAVGLPGMDRVGVVGAKVVDWDDPRQLRDVGRSADRFGHPYSPLQPGEIDQGQFDRVLEVLCVSSCAMLVARETWQRAGLFDERFSAAYEELDFCWRARVAGFRVLMTPLARVRHRASSPVADPPTARRHSARYEEDRSATAAMLKNYSLPSLLWALPLALALGVVRLVFLVLARRFEEAFDLLAAWGWNVAHLPGTLSRRREAQRARRVNDRALHRFMESAGLRLARWFETAERILDQPLDIGADEQEPVRRRFRERTASLVATHPVLVASTLGVLVGVVAMRGLWGSSGLAGGVLPAFPPTASGFFAEMTSGFRTTGLGGSLAASPALGGMGALSAVLFGSTPLAQKVMLGGALPLAAILMYRASVRLTKRPGPAVIAAAAYVASSIALWAFSQGRLGLLVTLAILPAVAERLEVAFSPDGPLEGRWRFIAGVGVTLAVLLAFLPGAALAVLVLVVVQSLAGARRRRGLALAGPAALAAMLLLLPFVLTLVSGRADAFASEVGTADVGRVARLAFGPGPGTWGVGAFLPIAALIAFGLVDAANRGRAIRAMLAALAGMALSWLSAAGYLPASLSDPTVYGALAAVGEAMIIAYGLTSAVAWLGRESFGLRQIGTALLTLVLGGGLLFQALAAMVGGWAVGGPNEIPPAWAVVSSGAKGDFRVLWIGAPDGTPFPAPGGDPSGVVAAGDATLEYALTGQDGVQALDVGRPLAGSGNRALKGALGEILSGATAHGGALLAPFGIRFVVAAGTTLPRAAAADLGDQLDLDLVPASGLDIYRNSAALPPAAVLKVDASQEAGILAGTPLDISELGPLSAVPMAPATGGWDGPATGGLVALATESDGAWRIAGSDARPQRSFGWATAFPETKGPVDVRYGMQWVRSLEVGVMAVLWAGALWVTRKPVRR